VSPERIAEAIAKGAKSPGEQGDRTVHEIRPEDSKFGRGLRVVTENKTGAIVTVIDRGSGR
jgi:hypothetical protein